MRRLQRTRRAEIAPLEDLEPNTAYEDALANETPEEKSARLARENEVKESLERWVEGDQFLPWVEGSVD